MLTYRLDEQNKKRFDSAKCGFYHLGKKKKPAVSLSFLVGNERKERAGWAHLTIAMMLPHIITTGEVS